MDKVVYRSDTSWEHLNFLALPPHLSSLERSRVVVVLVPYDSTVSFKSGTREGPLEIVKASAGLEDYDMELDIDVSTVGIHTTPLLESQMDSPRAMGQRIYEVVLPLIKLGKLVVLLGGEHSVSVGSVKAMREEWQDLSVLYLDAHADLRDEYMGTRWGHASVARRLHELCPVSQLGVRSMSQEEREYIRSSGMKVWEASSDGCYIPPIEQVCESLSSNVYISIDLDVFDPSLMPAVGTPEPGGIGWYEMIGLLKEVARRKNIVGFDITELSPEKGSISSAYTAAKLTFKLIAYSLLLPKENAENEHVR